MRRLSALLGAGLLTGLALLGLATPALAHNVLVSSDPKEGSSLSAGPSQVTLTFDQPVQAGFNTITVIGPDNTHWEAGDVSVAGNVVTAPVRPLGPAADYSVGYRILSADGHPVYGSVKFKLTTAGTGTPAPPSEAKSTTQAGGTANSAGTDGGMPVWPWIVGAVVLLSAGLVFALKGGKQGDSQR
ncbi:copper resistance protein CopC [Solihabitans fulvus]|uniref:Copper resistance protein CopC n=1 Tax=Solihabitans fulvus TaxID=1892852 RepID=A0A5B2XK96_9PSEU|nr:copper resistance CopC family protein [Solihabitans fulvus]KAA2263716.1 copper resistance protein CopC [Solihabitans fulvus]